MNWLIRSRVDHPSNVPRALRQWNENSLRALVGDERSEREFLLWNKPPAGIGCMWYQVGSGWEDWAKGNDFYSDLPGMRRTVMAVDPTRLLQIHTKDECADLQRRYRVDYLPCMEPLRTNLAALGYGLNWPALMDEYDGLELTGFEYEWGLDFAGYGKTPSSRWCYGWDCASGVLWNAHTAARILRYEDVAHTPAPSAGDEIAEHDIPTTDTLTIPLL